MTQYQQGKINDCMKKQLPIFNNGSILNSVLLLLFFLLFTSLKGITQDKHPHILASPPDKAIILEKISQQDWAKTIFMEMQNSVRPYVERHQTDPEWILSRYLMNRVPGKRYTKFYSDEEGTALVGYAGDAPNPTVRVSPHKRPPITSDGYSYKAPRIEELVPYDTAMKMMLQSNKPGAAKEWVDPQSFVDKINGSINQLALDAAIIYWLTGKAEYAKFAADLLSQWAQGAYYQQPIEGPCRTGFLSIQTLGDGNHEPMPLVYDFLYDYLRKQQYNTSWYETVFEKIAHTMTFRGFWNNNWFAAQTPALVFAALSLEDHTMRDYYLDYYLNKDTINGACGHLGLPSVVKQWLTPDGHWKEPGGYHNYPVSSLLISAMAMEKNGYPVFNKHPALFKASYVMLKYSFPNFMAPSIGDTGPASQSPECLEIGLAMAKKYADPILGQLTAAMEVLIDSKGYERSSADYLGLLCYLPEIPTQSGIGYTWPRSGELDFAKCYLQRNGTDRKTGLMYLVQGATYNHNHANGMSLELYGAGKVMGIDPGKGLTYEAPLHVNYYAQWAAHNTVSAAGKSASVPFFKGGGGTKKMGQVKLAAMEPAAEKQALSPFCSFTDTRYTDISTNTQQQRTLAIIRTSITTGYYVDLFRSDNAASNEYIYHNIGNDLQLLDKNRQPIAVKPATFPISQQPFDPPGFRNIGAIGSTGKRDEGLIALFSLTENKEAPDFMQVLFTGENGREFFSGMAPQSGTADTPYRNMPTPTIINRQEGEAWKRPFVAVYEPFSGKDHFSVDSIQREGHSPANDFTAIRIFNKDRQQQIVLHSLKPNQLQQNDDWKFRGNFAVINLIKNQLNYLYLGDGNLLSYKAYAIAASEPNSAANLVIDGNNLLVSCNQKITVSVSGSTAKTATLTTGGQSKPLSVKRTTTGISLVIPPIINASIQIK